MNTIKNAYLKVLLKEKEDEQLSKIKIKKGKMHNLLGLNPDEEITDKYTDGKKLAQDLYDKVKDKKEVLGMLAWAANINPDINIFDDALKSMDIIKESENINEDEDSDYKTFTNEMNKIQHQINNIMDKYEKLLKLKTYPRFLGTSAKRDAKNFLKKIDEVRAMSYYLSEKAYK